MRPARDTGCSSRKRKGVRSTSTSRDLTFSLQKQLTFGRAGLAIELNAFNVFNRANLAAPSANLSSALFGTITSTAPGFGPRQLQLGGKITV